MNEGTDRGRIAVVTGASAGVGRAVATELARKGFDVALLARGHAGLEAAALDVGRTGRRGLPVPTDVSNFDEVRHAAKVVESELGPIDLWVNDAMTTIFAPISQVEPEDFRRAVEVTFLGQVWGTKVALDLMVPRDSGTIVNVGSALAFVGIPLQSAYCSSKFACRGFFESVRAELAHKRSNVRMSMVHLPGVNTTQFNWCKSVFSTHPQPVPPIYQPEVAARAIVATALDGRRSKVLGAWNQLLVVLASLFPGLATQYAAVGAWDSQLTDIPVPPDRPANLWKPVDDDEDKGAHGIFDREAHGMLSPQFLEALPSTVKRFGVAFARTAQEKAHYKVVSGR
jgi:NAD(P)-dependent dehydrogenase (short-subunit alcohol dehydrogenase family)